MNENRNEIEKKLLDALGEVDDNYIDEAVPKKRTRKWYKWLASGAIAACLVFVLLLIRPASQTQSDRIKLSKASIGVEVRYIKQPFDPPYSLSYDLADFTEEQLFTKDDTTIFKGIITNITNIEIKYNGGKDFRALAEIKVQKVYRGNCKVGDTLTIFLTCPIKSNVMVEDTETISSMRKGMTGIFMPMKYDDTSILSEDGAVLHLKDIADYGFLDGQRYVFLESDNGLIFSKWAYESIENAKTLDDIEEYIKKMIS